MTKQQAKEQIEQLIERFDYHAADYRKGNYNETQTRNDFINQFFEALGWDVNNRQGLAECYREVIHEDKISISGSTKAPDYCFTVYGQRKFFLEAKKPSVNIKEQAEPAYQLRRYGWSAKMPISLITDFEELAIYDCTIKPIPTDKASVARIKYMTYKDYLKEFDFLWETFSKEQVLKGSFDKFVLSNKGKKGTTGVDAEFLKSLDGWRDLLARNIVNRNPAIGEDELNYSLQKIIDRLIFLRICEDRGVEREDQLRHAMGLNAFENLKQIFHIADQKYNSGLFDYKKDTITDNLVVDDKILKSIIEEMYYPKSPYEFSVIPVEILGHSYEQYLGKVIKITPGHRIKIEEKPEVRKAGGVYYTPQYIVDYIVKNTVGKLVEGKTPEEVAKIKICDPACGSGSFLLGAYQYLLDWHSAYYQENVVKNKDKCLSPDGHLTTSIKKQILLNNIHGVDIDTNAVEVTKLSLMLKAMEGETEASINNQLTLYHERVLPTLDNNIKSGNSLIDLDFYDGKIDFEPETEKKIKPFNWENAFPEVFKQGGFDVVIGNPPYVFTRDVDWPDSIKVYYWSKFGIAESNAKGKTNQSGKINLYILFLLIATRLTKSTGNISYIVPNGFLRTTTYDIARKFIIEKTKINHIIDLKDGVFAGVTASTIIINYTPNAVVDNQVLIIDANYKKDGLIKEEAKSFRNQMDFLNNVSYAINLYVNPNEEKLFKKMRSSNLFFKDIVIDIIEGIVAHKEFISDKKENEQYLKMLEGKDIKRYKISFNENYILFDRKKLHRARPDYVWNSDKKIIIQRISGGAKPLVASIDYDKYLSFASTNLILIKDEFQSIYNYELICALLNSNLLNFYYSKNFSNGSSLTVNISKTFLEMLPLPALSNSTTEITLHVQSMLQLNKDLQQAVLPEQKEQIKARINYTDKKIDKLVYELYGLTEEEIMIVEGE